MPAMDRAAGPNPAPPFIWMNTLNQAPNLKHHITPVRAGWFWDRFALHRRQASSNRPVDTSRSCALLWELACRRWTAKQAQTLPHR